jgi:diguanylate cyclase
MGRACAVCVEADGLEVDASETPLVRAPRSGPPSDAAIDDLDELLIAVKATLGLAVDERPAAATGRWVLDPAGRARTTMLECVTALDKLRAMLAHELGRRQRLELEVFDAQTALAQLRAELAGTQAGEQHARYLALHDGLTLLPNRGFFRERLDHLLARAEPRCEALAVLYIDLDGFKNINDDHGHDAGDELLRIVAARLTRAVRADDMVGRLGGDEFACLIGGLPSREQLGKLARKLFLAVSSPLQIDKLRLSVRPSIGIAMCPSDGDTSDALLKHADAAMYRSKRHQTGYAFFGQRADM